MKNQMETMIVAAVGEVEIFLTTVRNFFKLLRREAPGCRARRLLFGEP